MADFTRDCVYPTECSLVCTGRNRGHGSLWSPKKSDLKLHNESYVILLARVTIFHEDEDNTAVFRWTESHTLTSPVSKTPSIYSLSEEGNHTDFRTAVILCKKKPRITDEDQINTLNRYVTPLSKNLIYTIFACLDACRRFQSCQRKQTL
jgi:hypothetical protein